MSDHKKYSGDKLTLRLLAVTEDRTYHGKRKDDLKGFEALSNSEIDMRADVEEVDNHTIH